MTINLVLKGLIVDKGITKTEKEFVKIYANKELVTVYENEESTIDFTELKIGNYAEIKVQITTKNFFVKLL